MENLTDHQQKILNQLFSKYGKTDPLEDFKRILKIYFDILIKEDDKLIMSIFCKIIENKLESKLNVYPNPANSKIYVDLKTDNASAYILKMTNLLGERVMQSFIPKGNKGFLKSIDISDLPKGVYILEIESDTKHYTQRVVKN